MKFVSLFMSVVFCTRLVAVEPSEVDIIDYDWLMKNDPYESGEHLPYYKEIFDEFKDKNFLQLGMGYLTKYFIDHCKKVVSVQFVTNGCGPDPIKNSMALYKKFSNWIPISYFSGYQGDTSWTFFKYFGSENVYKANNYQTTKYESYSVVDPSYLKELNSFFSNLIKLNKFDFVHVAPNVCLRGELVQMFFGKIPIIIAGDANARINSNATSDIYGYKQVQTPDDYEEIELDVAGRTAMWILKDEQYAGLVERIKKIRHTSFGI